MIHHESWEKGVSETKSLTLHCFVNAAESPAECSKLRFPVELNLLNPDQRPMGAISVPLP